MKIGYLSAFISLTTLEPVRLFSWTPMRRATRELQGQVEQIASERETESVDARNRIERRKHAAALHVDRKQHAKHLPNSDAAVSGADPIETRAGFAALLARIEGNGVRTVIVRKCCDV